MKRKGDEEFDEEHLNPIAVLIDELRNEDRAIRLHAVNNLGTIAVALGPERTRSDLLHFFSRSIYDEDELLVALANQLGKFTPFVGGPEFVHTLLVPLGNMASVEDTVVREAVIENLMKLASKHSDKSFQEHYVPMVLNMMTSSSATSRVAGCFLIATCYARATRDQKNELISIFMERGQDESVMVRKSVVINIVPLAEVHDPVDRLLYLMTTFNDDSQDSVRGHLIGTVIGLLRVLKGRNDWLEFVRQQALKIFKDKSWRVKRLLAERITDVQEAFGKHQLDCLTDAYLLLIEDNEKEVRAVAVSKVLLFCRGLRECGSESIVRTEVYPAVLTLEDEREPLVKVQLASVIMGLGPYIGLEETVDRLLPIAKSLLKSDDSEARLNVMSSLATYNKAIGTERALLELLPAVVTLSVDEKWRVRQSLVECMTSLIPQLDVEHFDEGLLDICLAWLNDRANKVRLSASKFLQCAVQQFGNDWAEKKILPVLEQKATDVSSMFQARMTAVRCLRDLGFALDSERIVSKVIPILVKLSQDPVANIRFNVATCLEMVGPKLGEETVNLHIKPIIVKLLHDPENDVKFFAERACLSLGIGFP